MLKSCLIASFRKLIRDKAYAGIIIGSLAPGIGCRLVAFAGIAVQAAIAASAKPTDSLRYE